MSKILIIGAGLTGISAFKFFTQNLENKVFITDSKEPNDLSFLNNIDSSLHKFYFGNEFNLNFLPHFDFIVKSPGIPYTNQIISTALSLNIPIYTDVEFANELPSDIIAITGSNGKTTTTSLVGEIFANSKLSSSICGNIGLPILDFAYEDTKKEVLITELSSFQLKGTEKFEPIIAAFLNFNPTHLDFHGDETDYLESKLKIFKNLSSDSFAVLNYDDDRINRISITSEIKSPLFFFSKDYALMNGVFVKDDNIIFSKNGEEEFICKTSINPLKGSHNLENVLAAITIAKLYNIDNKTIIESISNFKSVEHRLESLESSSPFEIYNDSKSTNPTSTLNACLSFDKKIHLILGGMDRGADFSILTNILHSSVSTISLFGESKNLISNYLESINYTNYSIFNDLESATLNSLHNSSENDVVLFSPGCASWDTYSSYIERGNEFKKIVNNFAV